jgi:ferredoxin, 2Fe-2S
MPKVTFIEHSGVEHQVEGEAGKSLMQIAVDNGVPGILADCGGSATCGTCHCYIDPQWSLRVPKAGLDESVVLEGLLDTRATSRLTCQVVLTPELDGIVVSLPASQL